MIKMVNYLIKVENVPGLTIGYVGENNARMLRIKTMDPISSFAEIHLLIDTLDCGAMAVETEANYRLLSMLLDADMLGDAGMKTCQLVMLDASGDVVLKTNQFYMWVKSSNIVDRIYVATEDALKAAMEALIEAGVLTGLELDDGDVTTAVIANLAVTTGKIADGAVTTPKLANGSVTSEKLSQSGVQASHIANGAVTTAKIANGAITQEKLAQDLDFVSIDDTLTQEGAAADAKVVGDILHGGIVTDNMSADLQETIEQLGYKNKLIKDHTEIYACNLQNGQSTYTLTKMTEPSPLFDFENGAISSNYNQGFTTVVFFDEHIKTIEYNLSDMVDNFPISPIISDLNPPRTGQNHYHFIALYVNKNGMNGSMNVYKNDNDIWTRQTAQQPIINLDKEAKKVRVTFTEESIIYEFTLIDDTKSTITRTFASANVSPSAYPKRHGFVIHKAIANRMSGISEITGTAPAIFATSDVERSSFLKDVTWDAWGDSITAPSPTNPRATYPAQIEDSTGCIVFNGGVSGDTVNQILSRFKDRSDACGVYVTVFGGINDYMRNTRLEEMDPVYNPDTGKMEEDENCFPYHVRDTINTILTKCSGTSKFGWITPMYTPEEPVVSGQTHTIEDYVNVIIEECRKKSVPVLDLYHEGGWYAHYDAFNETYMGGTNPETADLLHPTEAGQTLLAKKILKFLESL